MGKFHAPTHRCNEQPSTGGGDLQRPVGGVYLAPVVVPNVPKPFHPERQKEPTLSADELKLRIAKSTWPHSRGWMRSAVRTSKPETGPGLADPQPRMNPDASGRAGRSVLLADAPASRVPEPGSADTSMIATATHLAKGPAGVIESRPLGAVVVGFVAGAGADISRASDATWLEVFAEQVDPRLRVFHSAVAEEQLMNEHSNLLRRVISRPDA